MKKEKLPNFFIIGAPKAGTTALSEYLREHPQVFFSEPKEPHYFNDDFSARHTYDYETYLSYFSNVQPEHKAIGEGSVFYLYSKNAVKNILDKVSDAKIIVMLRNPLELVPSLHMEAIDSHGENIYDIEKAWNMQDSRMKGKYLPKTTLYKEALYYGELAKLGKQVSRLFSLVPKERVHVIIFDDFKKNTENEYFNVLKFLEVDDYMPISFEKINASKGYKNIFLKKGMNSVAYIKRILGIKKGLGLGIGNKIQKWNTVNQKRKPISDEFRNELVNYFYEDVKLLSSLIDRDLLDEWKMKK